MLLLNTMKRYPLLEKIKCDVITNKEVIHSVFLQINKKQKEKCFQKKQNILFEHIKMFFVKNH